MVKRNVVVSLHYFLVGKKFVVELDSLFIEIQKRVEPKDGDQQLDKQDVQSVFLSNVNQFVGIQFVFNISLIVIVEIDEDVIQKSMWQCFSSTKTKEAFLYFTVGLEVDFEINFQIFFPKRTLKISVITPYIVHKIIEV